MKIIKESGYRIAKMTPEVRELRDELAKVHYILREINEYAIEVYPDTQYNKYLQSVPQLPPRAAEAATFELQTASFGSQPVAEIQKIIMAYKYGIEAVNLINDYAATVGLRQDATAYYIRADKDSGMYDTEFDDPSVWVD